MTGWAALAGSHPNSTRAGQPVDRLAATQPGVWSTVGPILRVLDEAAIQSSLYFAPIWPSNAYRHPNAPAKP